VSPSSRDPNPARTWLLFATVLVIATAGIVYELVAGAIASYVLGDSVREFSIVIGVYLSALGIGSYLSRFIDERLARAFVEVELATALVGGLSAPVLFLAYAYTKAFSLILYAVVTLVGTLVGLELPLLIRILKQRLELKELIARALTFDYVGALIGSLLFSLLLVPKLGLVRTSLVFGLLNAVVGIASTWFVGGVGTELRGARARGFVVATILIVAFTQSERITTMSEDQIYADEIIFAKQTAYQRIVVTRSQHSFQLFLNGNLQFASADEYRYHEALVHPAFAVTAKHTRVLIAGGGDGLAAREVLRYPDVESITLVDIDPEMTRISDSFPLLRELNGGSLHDPKLHVLHEDAMVWLGEHFDQKFDVIVVDFPDPNNFALGKLYTTRFYRLANAHLEEGGAMTVQSTSPLFARSSFWCIARTIESAGFSVIPYHAAVPSFGEWGFVLAKKKPFDPPRRARVEGLRFLDETTMTSLFAMSADMREPPVEINRLNNQILVQYYDREWKRWN
jgi:spermidine synthase